MVDITGTPGDDYLIGTFGGDVIRGLEGNDWLDGRAGNDTLNGGPGLDFLWGQGGADRFEFFADQGSDRIIDFHHGEDHIAIADFVTPDNYFLLFEDLDTDANGLLDDNDANVSYGSVDYHWQGLTVDLTPYAPGGTDSQLVLYDVSSLDHSDFV
jgi:Ca2+-binding RTX toxin-like protein